MAKLYGYQTSYFACIISFHFAFWIKFYPDTLKIHSSLYLNENKGQIQMNVSGLSQGWCLFFPVKESYPGEIFSPYIYSYIYIDRLLWVNAMSCSSETSLTNRWFWLLPRAPQQWCHPSWSTIVARWLQLCGWSLLWERYHSYTLVDQFNFTHL